MRRGIKVFAILISVVFLGALAISLRGRQSAADEKQEKAEAAQKQKNEGVKLDQETQERIGLQVQALESASIRPEITVYGTLEPDPSEEFVLRSPFAGVLISGSEWPSVGMSITAGRKVGSVRPLFAPTDRIALSEHLASARADLEAEKASVATAGQEVSRLKRLNAEDKNASDKAVQQAEAQLAGEEAKLKSAQSSVDLITASLSAGSGGGSGELEIHKGGQVTDVSAQPGESVEAGQALLRIARFHQLLARLFVPPGQTIAASATRAMISSAGQDGDALPAYRVALAPSVDPRYQGQIWLFRLAPGKVALRPGEAVTAHIVIPGPVKSGVWIPAQAILRFQGKTWVYVETETGRFVRRMATLEQAGKGGWFVASDFQPGERVVVSAAQTLLSEEMKSQLESDEE
jgi:multidrug efflux system membrane fusion protein